MQFEQLTNNFESEKTQHLTNLHQEVYSSPMESWQNKTGQQSQTANDQLFFVQFGGDTDLSGNPLRRDNPEEILLNNISAFRRQGGNLPLQAARAYVYDHCGTFETYQSRANTVAHALGNGYTVEHLPARRSIRLDPHRLIIRYNGQEVGQITGPQPGFFDTLRP